MTNMKTSSLPTLKRQQNAYQLNKDLNLESHGRHHRLEKKHADVKTTSQCNRKNPSNINAQNLKKAEKELPNVYQKEQTEYIQNQINKTGESVEDWQSRIAWQTVNEMSRRRSIAKAKLKATSQEERIYLWKQHFENLHGKPPKVTHEPITKIISNQLDFKQGQFTQEQLDSVLRKIKNKKAFGWNTPRSMENKGIRRQTAPTL